MIDESTQEVRRPTRAQQRRATRLAILTATVDCLVADGYAGLTTRRVGERAGIAQSTVMHHFPTRELLLVEAVTHLATGLAEDALDALDVRALRSAEQREAVLDQAWERFASPQGVAAAQLWAAAWAEPELAAKLNDLERRLTQLLVATAGVLFPDESQTERFPVVLDTAVTLLRGLVMAIPISGREAVDARWKAMKPVIMAAADDTLGLDR